MPGSMRPAKRRREGAVIASEAKQSIAPHKERMDCFVASAPRNDVDGQESAFPRRDPPEVCPEVSRLETRGRGECRMRAAPAVPCAKRMKKTHTSRQVQRRRSDIPCAMALRLTSRSPRRIGLVCLRRLRIWRVRARSGRQASEDLTPTTEASGPHDFTVRGQHRSSARRPIAHGSQNPLCHHFSRLTLPRPPHPAPRQ